MPSSGQNIHGVKRKRLHERELEEDKGAKLCRKLHHALRELRKVVRRTKTFEVQKTLKKLKDARNKDPESDATEDLVAQMKVLKHLNHDELAHSALVTKLKKDKTLSADPTIRDALLGLSLSLVSPGAPGTPTAKVQSRILSSKVLASEVVSILETLRTFLYPHVGSETGVRKATDSFHASPNMSKKRRTKSGGEKDVFSFRNGVGDPSDEVNDDEFENTSGDEAGAEVDDDWESGTVGVPSQSDDSVPGGADDVNSDDSSQSGFAPEDSKNKKHQPHGYQGQSEFLPFLSVGFTRGDSGGEFSDSETKSVDGIKKNRRGQRARRAIWERKFGKNAMHIKRRQHDTERRQPGSVPVDRRSGKGNLSLSSRSRRMPLRSRAPEYGDEQGHRPTRERCGSVKSSSSTIGRSGIGGDCRGKQRERPLHPSWEAKRKHKSASIVPSQGTKIIFSES